MQRNGQQVVESLMTYSWMILLVVAVLLVIYSLGLFSPLNFISPSSTVSGFSGVKVSAVYANYTFLEFYLTNGLSVPINLNKFYLTYNSTTFSNIKCQYLTLSPGQNSICFLNLSLSHTRDTVGLGMSFFVSNNITASSNGTISFVPSHILLKLPSTITGFEEEALPAGATWWVVYGGKNVSSTGSSISISTAFGNYAFEVSNVTLNGCKYTAVPFSGSLESGLVQSVIFSSSCAATFIEKNLPSGINWQVTYAGTVSSTTNNFLVFTNEKTGTHSFSVVNSVVGGCVYTPSPSSGTLSVGNYQYISFLGECTTTFTETGLSSGYNWQVTYDTLTKTNSSPNNIYYFGAFGSFPYSVQTLSNTSSSGTCTTTYTPSPSSGSASMGSTISIAFSAVTKCTTTFSESGLPSGYTWYVTYDSITNNSNAPSNVEITTKTSGSSILSFPYSVQTLSNTSSSGTCTTTYTPSPSSGSQQAGTASSVSFSASTSCTTTFSESGLSSGYTWYVTYDSITNNNNAPSNVIFHTSLTGSNLPVYSYSVQMLSNSSSSCITVRIPSPPSGSAQVGSTISITFSVDTTCVTTFTESNLRSGYPWNVTYGGILHGFIPSTSTQFTTDTSGYSIPTYSFSTPVLSSSTIEWAYGTSGYQGDTYNGMGVLPFPSSLGDLNNNGVACSSPYNSQGYSAYEYAYFSSSVTFNIWTDDATAVFYAPYNSNSWTSVYGSSIWAEQGIGSNQPYVQTISVTPGLYKLAVDWTNICGPGASVAVISGAESVSSNFNVIGWTPSNTNWDLLGYGNVTANPEQPTDISTEQTGSWSSAPFGYINTVSTPSPGSGSLSAGSTQSESFSIVNNSYTTFFAKNLPPGTSTWYVNYAGVTGPQTSNSYETIQNSNIGVPSNQQATAYATLSNGVKCVASAPVQEGITFTFQSWLCEFPVYLYNNQSISTPAPFQQELTMDPVMYSSYEASNLQNIKFTYTNGTVISSWLESGNSNSDSSAIYWLKIGGGIPANSDMEIYMDFLYPSSNLFNNVNTGEAPQLSSTYGEYDDGANVFNFYSNFSGSSLNSNQWTSGVGGGSVTVSNGVTISAPTSSYAYIIGTSALSSPMILDTYISSYTIISGAPRSFPIGFSTANNWVASSQGGNAGGLDNSYLFQMSNSLTSYTGSEYNLSNLVTFPQSISIPNVAGISWESSSPLQAGYINYQQVGTSDNTNITFQSFYPSAYIETGGAGSAKFTLNWISGRAIPPNGVMPSVTVTPDSLPSNIVNYAQVIVDNAQGPPPSGFFQQEVSIPSNLYTSYKASNLQNVEFFYADGTVIPSWLESGSSSSTAVYWLGLAGLLADSQFPIYIGFAPTSTNLFNNVNVGEAPQLSSTYGEYDDGANVFNVYTNFASSSSISGFTAYTAGGGSASFSNGATFTAGTSADPAFSFLVYNHEFPDSVASALITTVPVAEDESFEYPGFTSSSIPTSGITNYVGMNWYETCGYTYHGNNLYNVSSISSNTNGLSAQTVISSSDADITGYYNNAPVLSSSQNAIASDTYPVIGIQSLGSGSGCEYTETAQYQWFYIRSFPPNGIMPYITLNPVV